MAEPNQSLDYTPVEAPVATPAPAPVPATPVAPVPQRALSSQQAYYPDGTPIPDEALGEAVQNDAARWAKGTRVFMRTLDGNERISVDAEEARDAIRRGYARPESVDERKLGEINKKLKDSDNLAGSWAAHAWGVGDSLSLGGLSTVAAGQMNDEQRDLLRRFLDRHSTARTAGEIQAFFAPTGLESLVGKGTGALGRVLAHAGAGPLGLAELAGKSAGAATEAAARKLLPEGAARVAGAAVREGVQFAPFGAGKELSRQALGGEEYNTEKMMSAGGEAFLFGIATGGAMQGAKELFGAAGKALSSSGGLSGVNTPAISKSLDRRHLEVARALGVTGKDLEKIGKENFEKYADAAMEKGIISHDRWKALREELHMPAARNREWMKEVGASIDDVYKQADSIGTLDSSKLINESTTYIGKLRDLGGENTRIARKIEKDFFDQIAHTSPTTINTPTGPVTIAYGAPRAKSFEELHRVVTRIQRAADNLEGRDDAMSQALKGFAGLVKNETRTAIGAVDANLADKLHTADKLFGAIKDVEGILTPRAVEKELAAGIIEPHDIGFTAGGAAMGLPGVGAAIGGSRVASRMWRRSNQLHAAVARQRYMWHQRAVAQGNNLSTAVSKTASTGAGPVRKSVTSGINAQLATSFNERSGPVQESVQQPEVLANRLSVVMAPVAQIDPVQARNMTQTALADLQWLHSRLPPSISVSQLTDVANAHYRKAKDRALQVPTTSARAYVRTAKTLADPIKALTEVPTKGVTPELPEILTERRPLIKEAITRQFIQHAADLAVKGKQMSYKSRVDATLLTGIPFEPTMTPEYIYAAQEMWAEHDERVQAATAMAEQQTQAQTGSGRHGRTTRETRTRVQMTYTTAAEEDAGFRK